MQTLNQVLKPEWKKILLFLIFIAIAIGGKIQAWAFTDMPPKPLLYDWIRPFPIWPIWMLLLMPLAVLVYPLRLLGIDVMGGPAWLFLLANIIYFYILSCIIVSGLVWIIARWRSQRSMAK
jgi:hypothetical protein